MTTEEKDGFSNGENFQWYINFNGVDYQAEAIYSTDFDPGLYVTNAMTFVTSLTIVEPGCTDETALNYMKMQLLMMVLVLTLLKVVRMMLI